MRHSKKVQMTSQAMAEFYRNKQPFRIFHGHTNSTRILTFDKSATLDMSGFDEVLSVDTERQAVIVEPNVPMDKLLKCTMRHGLVPPVVPEFPGITVGGGIQGGAGESSSFKWGFLSQTCNWVEYMLGEGSIVKSSPENAVDLFYGAAGSCGTLGVILAAELKLVPAKKYVVLTYHPVASFEEAINLLQSISKQQVDFLDAIMFGSYHGVVIAGVLSEEKQGKVKRFSRAHDQWYYLHVQAIDLKRQAVSESVPLIDYLFRYNRGAFWAGKYAFELFGIPFNRFWRLALNPILHTRKLYQALQASGTSQEYFIQDLTLPIKTSVTFLKYIDKKLGVYPLWLCPVKPEARSPLACNGLTTPLAINVGVWGPRITDYDEFKKLNRDVEHMVYKLGGKKWMYAHTYYTNKEFWRIYDKQWYDRLRKKYKAIWLPSIYEKVVVNQYYVIHRRRGLLQTILGIAKLRFN